MKHSFRIVLALALLSSLSACKAERNPALNLAPALDPLVHRLDNSGAICAVRVLELLSGRELYALRADEPVIPASNMKLQTVAAALDRLGENHVFRTYLAMDGDDLWLIGTGDPSCGDPKMEAKHGRTPTSLLDDWAGVLKQRGITQIRGKLHFYDGAFDNETICPGWSRGYLTDWYAAPVTGLNFNDNCIDVTAIATEPGKPAKLEVIPPTMGNRIINECTTAAPGESETVDMRRDRENNIFTVTGKVQKRTELKSRPVTDPAAFFADALRTNFASHGITIAGPTERAPAPLGGDLTPPKGKIIAVHESKMADVIKRLNKDSQNLFAEALAKYLGREYERSRGRNAPGSWKSANDAMHDFFERHGIDHAQFVAIDGSGLARGNRVTARLITEELAVMRRHRYAQAFIESLPIGGEDGTIGRRMTDIKGHVFAKTGYISGVRALSGYIKTRQGRWLAFSVIFNQLPGSVGPAEDIQDNVCRMLVEYPHIEKVELKPMRPATTRATSD